MCTPDWSFWLNMATVELGQACALAFNIDPLKVNQSEWGNRRPTKDEVVSKFGKLIVLCKSHENNEGAFSQSFACGVHLREFARFCLSIGWEIPAELATLAKNAPQVAHPTVMEKAARTAGVAPETDTKNAKEKPLQRQRFQENEIIRVIYELSYNPKNLPKQIPGKSGVKAEVREKLLFSVCIFNKAWCSGQLISDTSLGCLAAISCS